MMTAGDEIFKIIDTENSEGQIFVKVSVNNNSEIFKGHFPGQPVVPGACIVQLVKDVLEDALGESLVLKKAGNIKFSNMMVPKEEQTLQLVVNYTSDDEVTFSINAKLSEGEVVCFKLQGNYIII